MIRIKVMRLSGVVYPIIVVILIAAILFLLGRLILAQPDGINDSVNTNISDNADESLKAIYKNMLSDGVPAIGMDKVEKTSIIQSVWNIISLKKYRDPRNLMHCLLPYLGNEALSFNPYEEAIIVDNHISVPDRSSVDRKIVDPPEKDQDGRIDMDSSLPEEIKIKIKGIKDDQKPIELDEKGKGPKVLIYHTHSREAYRQDSKNKYDAVEAFRTDDLKYTVMNVGEQLAAHLKKNGIAVLHDKTEHEQGNYDAAYDKSLKSLMKQMKNNESLQIFLDIHRNAYKEGTKDPDNEVVIIDGKRVAKVFVVIGTGEGLIGGFNEKPDWEKNYKFALKLTNKINELYPGLAKDVYVRTGRFNQHVSDKAILIEVGSTLTTLEESRRATKYVAEALSQIVK